MKILLVDVVYGHSSTGKIVKDIKDRLENKGHEVLVCYGRHDESVELGAVKIANGLEILVHVALTRLTGLTGCFSPFATIKLIKLIEQFKPDIIHLHEIHGYFLNINALVNYLKVKRIPVVWTFHSEFMYTGKCGYSYDCEQWITECIKCPLLHEYPESWYFDFTNLMFHQKKSLFENFNLLRITTPSEWLANRVRQSFLSGKKIDVVHNGIDTENVFFPHDSSKLRKKLGIVSKYIVVAIAPDLMSQRKGGRWVIEAAKKMANMDISFVMVGVDKPNEVLLLPNLIVLPKITDQNELAQYYSLGDLFLLTSEKETFSLTCVESLACGTPVVGFEAGAPSEIVPNGYGYFVPYGDTEQLCAAIEINLNNPSLLFSSEQCKKYANLHYGKDIMVENFQNIYFEMVSGK